MEIQMKLRSYQKDLVNDIENEINNGTKRLVMQLNTGGGKTICAAQLLKNSLDRGERCAMISHRIELMTQSSGAMSAFNLPYGVLSAKHKEIPDDRLSLIMLETIKRRIQMSKEGYLEFVKDFDLLILDEAHLGSFDRLFRFIPDNTIVIGLTATPQRRGNTLPMSDFYEKIVSGINTIDLITKGYLSKSRSFGQAIDLSRVRMTAGDYDSKDQEMVYSERMVFDGVIKAYKKHCNGEKALLFASTVDSSIDIMNRFRTSGISSMHVDSSTPKGEREIINREYAEGKYQVLCNCDIYSIGFDDPGTKAIILYKATRSLTRYLQMIGRGARTTIDKKEFKILDFGQNIENHSYFETPRSWSLDNERPTPRRREERRTKICPECDAIVSVSTITCDVCGHIWERTRIEQLEERIEVELKELGGFDVNLYSLHKSFDELQIIQKLMKYKESWIYWQLSSESDLIAFARYKGYQPGWVWYMKKKGWKPVSRDEREKQMTDYIDKVKLQAQR